MEEKIARETDLEDWRRTHYSFQIENNLLNNVIIVIGWISSKRDHGNVLFIQLRDRFGDIQIVVKKKVIQEGLFEILRNLKEHSSLAIKGKVINQKNSPDEFEIIPEEIKILSISNKPSPFLTQSISSVGIDTRLDLRALDLRRNYLQNVFKIRNTILRSTREFLVDNYFIEVNTPKMISTATEGGAALFPIFYYDREAFLAQSPQLYKEQLTMAFENVFEIAPIFRAEPSRTNRHLSEAISIDVEKAYVDYQDIMDILDNLVSFILKKITEDNKDELSNLDTELPKITLPFKRYTYTDLVRTLQKNHKYIRWGDDISPKILRDLVGDTFYYITDWPLSAKPFYVKPKKKTSHEEQMESSGNQEISESFDLMYGTLELSSGSTRINNKDLLMDSMKKKGLNFEAFDYHLRVFDYGVPPHAGFGLGLERLVMAILKLENIRDATFYPRDIDRLTP